MPFIKKHANIGFFLDSISFSAGDRGYATMYWKIYFTLHLNRNAENDKFQNKL